jgi:hypothetical protein
VEFSTLTVAALLPESATATASDSTYCPIQYPTESIMPSSRTLSAAGSSSSSRAASTMIVSCSSQKHLLSGEYVLPSGKLRMAVAAACPGTATACAAYTAAVHQYAAANWQLQPPLHDASLQGSQ